MGSYSWNALDYEKHSSAQQTWARELIGKLSLKGDERVLDVGCGDGKVTAEIANLLPHGSVIGIDSSEAMINLAKNRYPVDTFPNLQFVQMDARKLSFESEFTLVFSNAALHWIQDHVSVLRGISNSLQSGGKALLQMGGRGTAADIVSVIEEMIQSSQWRAYFTDFAFPYSFYSPQEYEPWLEAVSLEGIRIELIPKDMTHSGVDGLAGWLRTTWLPYTQQLPEARREPFITELVQRYLEHHPIDEEGLTHVQMIRLEVEAKKV